MATLIRKATNADAEDAIDTLRRSICELCAADHHGDAKEIEAWLSNKTVASWHAWLARDEAAVFVAEKGQMVAGVGMVTMQGEILLNYVHPEARFSGVSKSMLAAMENELRARNVKLCQLESTETALGFYLRCGFQRQAAASLRLSKTL